jgi:membrane protein implicated in regulation of membrane protease activity
MDLLTAPIALLIGLGLAGIILPFAASFILDGIVNQIRGRGPRVLIVAGGVTIIIAVVFAVVWQAGLSEAPNAAINSATDADTLSGSLQLLLLFTIPIALLVFGGRMVSRFVNPDRRAKEQALLQRRRDERTAADTRAKLMKAPPPSRSV